MNIGLSNKCGVWYCSHTNQLPLPKFWNAACHILCEQHSIAIVIECCSHNPSKPLSLLNFLFFIFYDNKIVLGLNFETSLVDGLKFFLRNISITELLTRDRLTKVRSCRPCKCHFCSRRWPDIHTEWTRIRRASSSPKSPVHTFQVTLKVIQRAQQYLTTMNTQSN